MDISLNVLLHLLVLNNFKNEKCIVYSLLPQNSTLQHLEIPILFDINTPIVINPTKCIPGCNQYILYEPEIYTSWIANCLHETNDFKFRAIIFLESSNQENINTYMTKAYVADTVLIYSQGEYFTIAAFDDWNVTHLVKLNFWDHKRNSYLLTNQKFFRDNLKYKNRGEIVMPYADQSPIYYRYQHESGYGTDYEILREFSKNQNFQIDDKLRETTNEYKEKLIFVPSTNEKGKEYYRTNPMSMVHISYMVPKPRMIRHWLQFIEVLPWDLWLAIIFTYIAIAIYFWIYEKFRGEIMPTFESVVKFFLQQGFDLTYTSTRILARVPIAMLLILGLLYASLYSGGIADTLIAPRYEKVIKTMTDLAESNIFIHQSELFDYSFMIPNETTELERTKIFTAKRLAITETVPYSERAFFFTRSEYKVFYQVAKNHIPMDESFHYIYTWFQMVSSKSIDFHLILQLNTFALWCKEAGLPYLWETEFKNNEYKYMPQEEKFPYFLIFDVERKPLSIEHLNAIFTIWVGGFFLSAICLVIELINVHFLRWADLLL